MNDKRAGGGTVRVDWIVFVICMVAFGMMAWLHPGAGLVAVCGAYSLGRWDAEHGVRYRQ